VERGEYGTLLEGLDLGHGGEVAGEGFDCGYKILLSKSVNFRIVSL
jgi:hypothetical protein